MTAGLGAHGVACVTVGAGRAETGATPLVARWLYRSLGAWIDRIVSHVCDLAMWYLPCAEGGDTGLSILPKYMYKQARDGPLRLQLHMAFCCCKCNCSLYGV